MITDLVVVASDVGGALMVQRCGKCHQERGEKEEEGGKQDHLFWDSWLGDIEGGGWEVTEREW